MAMKESGIEWVGLIPDTWSVIPNKYVMHKEKNLCEKWSGEDVMSLTMNGVIVRDLQNPTGKMPATFDGYQYIEDGDLLMCLFDIDVTPRCFGRVTHDGVTSPAYSNFKVHDNASRDYFYYYYLMVDNTKELLHLAKNLRHSFTEEQLGQLKVPMPPLSEQQAIADYLDKTCSKIDEIIAEAKASIDEYKELRIAMICNAVTFGINGIRSDDVYYYNDYLPAVPKNWNIMKGKYILTPLSRDVKDDDGVVTCFRDGEVTLRSNRREKGFTNSIKETGYQGVEPGDLVVHGMDGFAGAIGISDSRGKMSPIINVLDSNQNKKYVMYYLRNLAYKDVFLGLATGIRERSCDLRWDKLADLEYLIPSKTEQQEIVEWLDEYMPKYDSLIAEKESLINDLEAYKKSLIYEVVTGKRRVV